MSFLHASGHLFLLPSQPKDSNETFKDNHRESIISISISVFSELVSFLDIQGNYDLVDR